MSRYGQGTVVLDEHVMDVVSIRLTGGRFEIRAEAHGPTSAFSGSGWVLFGDDGVLVASNPNRKQRLDVPALRPIDSCMLILQLNFDYVAEGAGV